MKRLMIRSFGLAMLLLVIAAVDAIAQRNCVRGIPCGNTCIAANRTCRVGSGTATSNRQPAAAVAATSVPDSMLFVGSTRGRTYYYRGCNGWKGLAASNLRYFRDAEQARAAGYSPSTQAGCAGPASAQGTATGTPVGPVTAMSAAICAVASITDGDTLTCADGRKMRLLLIDAPEIEHGAYGLLAKAQLESMAPIGTVLRVEQDVGARDPYGRDLAYLYLPDGRSINLELLRSGMAVVSVHPPNVKYVDVFRAASDSAKGAGRGLWATPAFQCSPTDFRDGKCR